MAKVYKKGDRVVYFHQNIMLHRRVELLGTVIQQLPNGNYKIELDSGKVLNEVDWISIKPLS